MSVVTSGIGALACSIIQSGWTGGAPLLRDAKLIEIDAGTSEIRRMLVGRELMGAMG